MLLSHDQTTTSDAHGHYVFDRVAPGNAWLCRRTHAPWDIYEAIEYVDVEPGKTVQTMLGGAGRPIIGKLSLPPGSDEKIEWKIDRTTSFSAALMIFGGQIAPEFDGSGDLFFRD